MGHAVLHFVVLLKELQYSIRKVQAEYLQEWPNPRVWQGWSAISLDFELRSLVLLGLELSLLTCFSCYFSKLVVFKWWVLLTDWYI